MGTSGGGLSARRTWPPTGPRGSATRRGHAAAFDGEALEAMKSAGRTGCSLPQARERAVVQRQARHVKVAQEDGAPTQCRRVSRVIHTGFVGRGRRIPSRNTYYLECSDGQRRRSRQLETAVFFVFFFA
jgi:hypothetical protein